MLRLKYITGIKEVKNVGRFFIEQYIQWKLTKFNQNTRTIKGGEERFVVSDYFV